MITTNTVATMEEPVNQDLQTSYIGACVLLVLPVKTVKLVRSNKLK